MKFVSDDGKLFTTAEECEKHEAEIREVESKKLALETEIDKKWGELLTLTDEYNKLLKQSVEPDNDDEAGNESGFVCPECAHDEYRRATQADADFVRFLNHVLFGVSPKR